jgi:hypothetical protein
MIPIRALVLSSIVGCSSSSSNSTWTYTVNFESLSAAVSADTLEVDVYDASLPDSTCDVLIVARRSQAALPKPVVSVPPTPVCTLATGHGGVSVKYGKYSVLAVAKHQGQDWLIGCNTQYVTHDEDPGTLPIELTNFDEKVEVPATKCQSLSAHCSSGC